MFVSESYLIFHDKPALDPMFGYFFLNIFWIGYDTYIYILYSDIIDRR
jgi:hypothetical protein